MFRRSVNKYKSSKQFRKHGTRTKSLNMRGLARGGIRL